VAEFEKLQLGGRNFPPHGQITKVD
jgi:hypothetical protein